MIFQKFLGLLYFAIGSGAVYAVIILPSPATKLEALAFGVAIFFGVPIGLAGIGLMVLRE